MPHRPFWHGNAVAWLGAGGHGLLLAGVSENLPLGWKGGRLACAKHRGIGARGGEDVAMSIPIARLCVDMRLLLLAPLLACAAALSLAADEASEAAPATDASGEAVEAVEMILVLRHDAGGGEPWTVPAVVVDAAAGGPSRDAVIRLVVEDSALVPASDQRVVQVQAVPGSDQHWHVQGVLRPWSASSAKLPKVDLGERYRQQLAEALQAQPVLPTPLPQDQDDDDQSSQVYVERPVRQAEQPRRKVDQALAAVLIPGERMLVEYYGRLRVGPALLLLDDPESDESEMVTVRIEAVDGRFAIINHVPPELQHLRLRQPRAAAQDDRQ